MQNFLFAIAILVSISIHVLAQINSAQTTTFIQGINLSDTASFPYDAGSSFWVDKTYAVLAVERIKAAGFKHIILNPKAVMKSPFANEVLPMTAPDKRKIEAERYKRLIKYIHEQGMTVGIRPIFFVVNAQGEPKYVYNNKIWWHGVIEPQDPKKWFVSFRDYLSIYMKIAKEMNVEEFTLGAELNTLTTGLYGAWKEYPRGVPELFVDLIQYARTQLPEKCRIMYDINFTDQINREEGPNVFGGELERWRYLLVDKQDANDPKWQALVQFWKEIDVFGLDFYRGFARSSDAIPADDTKLLQLLTKYASGYASQLDTILAEIEATVGISKKVMFKEVGFRSGEKAFVHPYYYESKAEPLNLKHQAIAYEAFFQAFWVPQWSWFGGVNFWDAGTEPTRYGIKDNGFSPLGKPMTEAVLKKYFQ